VSIQKKVKKLEKMVYFLSAFCVLNFFIFAFLFYLAYAKQDFKEVNTDILIAKSLIIHDKNHIVVELGSTQKGGYIETVTRDGSPLVSLGKTAIGGTVTLYNTNGHGMVELGNTRKGGFIGTYNTKGKRIIELNRTGYGGDISIFDNSDKLSAHITTVQNGGVVSSYLNDGQNINITPSSNAVISPQ
jgi:hypothetical protein